MIDELYWQILRLSFKAAGGHILETYKQVLGTIILAKTPLHHADIKHFLEGPERELSIDTILRKLSSVILLGSTDGKLHINHLSFMEFICDPRHCDEVFVIDFSHCSQAMALACFRLMEVGLRFNICQIMRQETGEREEHGGRD